MILAIFIPILIYGGALLVGSALGAGGIYVMGAQDCLLGYTKLLDLLCTVAG